MNKGYGICYYQPLLFEVQVDCCDCYDYCYYQFEVLLALFVLLLELFEELLLKTFVNMFNI